MQSVRIINQINKTNKYVTENCRHNTNTEYIGMPTSTLSQNNVLCFHSLQQKSIVERLVKDKSELLEKNHDAQTHYEHQIEQLRNQVRFHQI